MSSHDVIGAILDEFLGREWRRLHMIDPFYQRFYERLTEAQMNNDELRELINRLDSKFTRVLRRLDGILRNQGILSNNQRILQEEGRIMNAAELLANIKAKKDIVKAVAAAADGLEEGFASVNAKIADLKAQVEAGQTPDFTEVETELAEMDTALTGLGESILAGTPQEVK